MSPSSPLSPRHRSRRRRPDRGGASSVTEHLGTPSPISAPASSYVMHRAWWRWWGVLPGFRGDREANPRWVADPRRWHRAGEQLPTLGSRSRLGYPTYTRRMPERKPDVPPWSPNSLWRWGTSAATVRAPNGSLPLSMARSGFIGARWWLEQEDLRGCGWPGVPTCDGSTKGMRTAGRDWPRGPCVSEGVDDCAWVGWAAVGQPILAQCRYPFFSNFISILFFQFQFKTKSTSCFKFEFKFYCTNKKLQCEDIQVFLIIYFFYLLIITFLQIITHQNMPCIHTLLSLKKYNFYCRLDIRKYFNMILFHILQLGIIILFLFNFI